MLPIVTDHEISREGTLTRDPGPYANIRTAAVRSHMYMSAPLRAHERSRAFELAYTDFDAPWSHYLLQNLHGTANLSMRSRQ